MKKFITKFVIKTWFTLLGIFIFCIMYWIPPLVASIISGGNPCIFEHYILLLGIIVASLYAIYALVAWLGLRWILQDYMKTREYNHPFFEFRLSKSGTHEDRVQDLKADILGAKLFFSCCIFIIVILVLDLCNLV